MQPIQYKSYTIQPDHRNPYGKSEFMFYPTEEGVQHDGDCTDGESFSYCGNCEWASTLEGAKEAIDELTANIIFDAAISGFATIEELTKNK